MSSKPNLAEGIPTVVGLDIGSSVSKIAVVTKGAVEIITNEANFRHTPTVVGYGKAERYIGEAGSAKIKSNVANTIIAPHRFLGWTKSQFVEKESIFLLSPLEQESDKIVFSVDCQGKQEKLTPEQTTGAFLTSVQKIIRHNQLADRNMVIAVPAYYTQHERQALLDAVSISSKNNPTHPVQLVNQTVAVGLEYRFDKSQEFSDTGRNVLFIDFGHSKLSIFLLHFGSNSISVVLQSHHRSLGCKDLDMRMLQHYVNIFSANKTHVKTKLYQSKKAMLKLMENIEKQRKVLSGNSEYDFIIQCLVEDEDFACTMKRDEFQTICQPIFSEIRLLFRSFAEKLHEDNISFEQIQLIGGGTRIPMFLRIVQQELGLEPSRTLNSSQCIARGAALASAMNSSLFRIQRYQAKDLSNYTVKCIWRTRNQQIEDGPQELILLNKNQQLESYLKVELSLPIDRKCVDLELIYANLEQGLQHRICSFSYDIPANNIDAEQVSINCRVEFNLNINRMLSLSRIILLPKQTELQSKNLNYFQRLSKQAIKEYAEKQAELDRKDTQIMTEYENRNKMESFIYVTKDKFNEILNNPELNQFVSSQMIVNSLESIKSCEQDFWNYQISDYDAKRRQLTFLLQQIKDTIEQCRQKHRVLETEVSELEKYLENLPKEELKMLKMVPLEIVELQQWVIDVKKAQQSKRKWEEPVTKVEDVKRMNDMAKRKVAQICKQHQNRVRNQPQHNYFLRQPQQRQQPMLPQYLNRQVPTSRQFNKYQQHPVHQRIPINEDQHRLDHMRRSMCEMPPNFDYPSDNTRSSHQQYMKAPPKSNNGFFSSDFFNNSGFF